MWAAICAVVAIKFFQIFNEKKIYFIFARFAKGLVTTTQVTHASPAGVYAHTANRNWESNQMLLDDGGDPEVCTDIAKQLVNGHVGKKLKVSKVKQHYDNDEHVKRGQKG